jgi:DNA-binding transcriptional ArsR family regulator
VSSSPTLEALSKEFERITRETQAPEGFVSTREYAAHLGVMQEAAGRKLRLLFDAGLLEVRQVARLDMTGRRQMTPVYRIRPRVGRGAKGPRG